MAAELSKQIIPVGTYAANCIVLWQGADALVVDPGQDAADILAFLKERHLAPKAVLLTHGHFDHVGGVPGLLAAFPGLAVYAHPADWPMLDHPMNRNPPDYPGIAKPSTLLDIRAALDLPAALRFEVLETPGHTPGSVCLRFGGLLLSGDTLFAGSCGRTDFPGGSMAEMRKSLAALAKLPPDLEVVPGHGPSTTIGREVAENPFMER